MNGLTIEIEEPTFSVKINGVSFTVSCLAEFLENPPPDAVFSFRRVENKMAISIYRDMDAVAKFFEKQ